MRKPFFAGTAGGGVTGAAGFAETGGSLSGFTGGAGITDTAGAAGTAADFSGMAGETLLCGAFCASGEFTGGLTGVLGWAGAAGGCGRTADSGFTGSDKGFAAASSKSKMGFSCSRYFGTAGAAWGRLCAGELVCGRTAGLAGLAGFVRGEAGAPAALGGVTVGRGAPQATQNLPVFRERSLGQTQKPPCWAGAGGD